MEFKRNENANYASHLLTTLYIAPARLVELFGPPDEDNHSDGYKVSGGYTFEVEEGGKGVEVYDYKETNLYDRSSPTPERFWTSTHPQRFSVGGTDPEVGRAFVRWVNRQQ